MYSFLYNNALRWQRESTLPSASSNTTLAITLTSSPPSAIALPPSSRLRPLISSSAQTTSVKLDWGNYMFWESIVLPHVKGNCLLHHIDGSGQAPPRLTTDGTANPEYVELCHVDRLLLGWLRNFMTQDVGTQLMHCQTAKSLWDAARTLTCAATKSRMIFLMSPS